MIELCHFRFFWCFFFLWALKVLEVIIQNHRIIYFSFTFSWMTMTFDAILEDIFCRKLVYCQQEIWYNTGCYPSTPFSELAHNINHMTSFFCVKQQLSSFFSCRLPSSSSLFFSQLFPFISALFFQIEISFIVFDPHSALAPLLFAHFLCFCFTLYLFTFKSSLLILFSINLL